MKKAVKEELKRRMKEVEKEELERRLRVKWPKISKTDGRDEIGRELQINELRVGDIVAISVEGYPGLMFTFHVQGITDEHVFLYSAELQWIVKNFRRPDGTLTDGKGKRVHVWQWKPS